MVVKTRKARKPQDMTLGELLRTTRLNSGLSQAEVAEKLETSQGNLSRWERDLSYPQDPDTLVRIQKFVKVEQAELIVAVVAAVAKNTRSSLRRLFEDFD